MEQLVQKGIVESKLDQTNNASWHAPKLVELALSFTRTQGAQFFENDGGHMQS